MIATPPRSAARPSEKPRLKRQDLLKEILALRREVEALRQEKRNLQYMLEVAIQHVGIFPENVQSEKKSLCGAEDSFRLPIHHPSDNS